MATQEAVQEPGRAAETGRTRRKVLLGEDETSDATAFEAPFQEHPAWDVAWFMDGAETLEFALKQGRYRNAWTPNLIVLCICMPMRNGLEVLRMIKKVPDRTTIRVVMWTVSDSSRSIKLAYRLGAAAYLAKPFHADGQRRQLTAIRAFWAILDWGMWIESLFRPVLARRSSVCPPTTHPGYEVNPPAAAEDAGHEEVT